MSLFRKLARPLRRKPSEPRTAPSVSDADAAIIREVRPFTMTSQERILAVLDAVDYIVNRDLPGAFAECGVWRGGSVMAMLRRLQSHGISDRDVYLFDTFSGMTEPTPEDVSDFSEPASRTWAAATARGDRPWGGMFEPEVFDLDSVRQRLLATGYPPERLHFVQGPVESTLPEAAPTQLALLRLDTDWYESTRHELIHLYPRLGDGGVLIIDDYGHWKGCRQAVDEYFGQPDKPRPLFARIDYTGCIGVKH